ncbi:hypothetical protein [Paenibacillus elgii]|nr:hypothetical protein [Paenibacillus elgii]
MFNVREHIITSYPWTNHDVIEKWVERAERLISIEQALGRPVKCG